jgi:hypothetical protein
MLILNRGQDTEVAVRVYLESDCYGRKFFDGYDSLRECLAALSRLARSCVEETQTDGVGRQVGIAIVPVSEYGSEDGYGYGIDEEDDAEDTDE